MISMQEGFCEFDCRKFRELVLLEEANGTEVWRLQPSGAWNGLDWSLCPRAFVEKMLFVVNSSNFSFFTLKYDGVALRTGFF